MPAAITDKFNQATNGTRPVPTTLTATRAIGASSITVGALTGWPTATAVHFSIYQVDTSGNKVAGSQTDWKGTASGTTISNLTLEAGSDSGDSVGAIVECGPTAAWANDVVNGILVDHDQSGQHKNLTDANGNEWIKQTATASAVNEITVANAATGNGPVISATGGDTNVDIKMTGKGTGKAYQDSITEYAFDFIVSGMVWSGDSYGSTRAASMTAGYAYISGVRVTVAAVTARSFTASKDTYIDLGSDGVLDYTEVANNAASPALAANHIRVGIIVTGASSIANAGSVNQGQMDKVLPIASSIPYSVTDSLGNLICPRDPNRKVLGYRQRITSQSATTEVQITELSVPVLVPANRLVKVTIWTSRLSNDTAGNGAKMGVWDGTVGSGTLIAAASFDGAAINNAGVPVCQSGFYKNNTSSTESKTFNGSIGRNGAGNATFLFTAFTNLYAWLLVELV